MIPPLKSYSQAGQDLFIAAIIARPEELYDGSFLDVGACHPTELSNTYALESQLHWRGMLVDNDPGAVSLLERHRASPVVLGDATKLRFQYLIAKLIEKRPIDYLSLDVDSATLDALKNLMTYDGRFRAITIETDAYRFGDGPRREQRRILTENRYRLVCSNVCATDGSQFEDWYVDPKTVPEERYKRFICENKKWTEIMGL